MRIIKRFFLSAAAGIVGGAMAGLGPALAQVPQPWQLNFQPPASPVMEQLYDFHTLLVWIISVISIFVLGLLLYVIVRFRESRNPVPSRTTHHTLVEVAWTVVPVLILVVIAIPSLRILYFSDRIESAEMTLKAIGHQWYWSYEYPDHGNFTFDSLMKQVEELAEGEPRLLATDTRVVLPVDTNIRLLITADDVLHAWTVPAFGVKRDAVPGRINETWVRIDREGLYFGQCSEFCGKDHAYMPITVEAVSKEKFQEWVTEAQSKFAKVEGAPPAALAAAAPAAQPN